MGADLMQHIMRLGCLKHSFSHHENCKRVVRKSTLKRNTMIHCLWRGHGLATAYYFAKEFV